MHTMAFFKVCWTLAIVACVSASPTNFNKETSQITEYLGLTKNSYQEYSAARSDASLEDNVEKYIKSHDAKFELPLVASTVTLETSNLDQDELNIKLKFSDESEVQARKKSKLKKIFVPILVFILLKAITLVPLALGILGIKAWNSLQLSFFSFIISVSLAVFQLCKKLAAGHEHSQIVAHNGWDGHHQRSLDVPSSEAQQIAYSAYSQ